MGEIMPNDNMFYTATEWIDANNDTGWDQNGTLFGTDRKLGETYDFGKPVDAYNEIIDALLKTGMSNDAIEDEIRNVESMGVLNDMREGSETGAMGNVDTAELERLMRDISPRKQMSPERIHNLGILYGSPLSQERINYFENQMNRDPNQSYMGNFPKFPK